MPRKRFHSYPQHRRHWRRFNRNERFRDHRVIMFVPPLTPTLIHLASEPLGFGRRGTVRRHCSRPPSSTSRRSRSDSGGRTTVRRHCRVSTLIPAKRGEGVADGGIATAAASDHQEALATRPHPSSRAISNGTWVAATFPGRAWIAAELHLAADDAERIAEITALADALGLPVVASNDVHMHVRGRRALQDVLTATRLRTTVAGAGFARFPNAERHLRRIERLAELYPAAWIAESVAIAARCTFSLDELRYEYPEEIAPTGETPTSWLRAMTEAGLAWRFGSGPAPWVVAEARRTSASANVADPVDRPSARRRDDTTAPPDQTADPDPAPPTSVPSSSTN